MNLSIKFVIVTTIVIGVLVAMLYFLNFFSTTSDINARNVFTEGCLRYCEEISKNADPITEAINKSEALEGAPFIAACKLLYTDVKYNWQCWNRECCKFTTYNPV